MTILTGDPGPAMPWYVAEALSSARIQSMTLEEECCYRRLLDYQWQDGIIPSDFEKIRSLCKSPRRKYFYKIWQVVGACFVPSPDGIGLINEHLHFLRQERLAFKAERAKSGKAGMAKRWKNHNSANSLAIAEHITNDNSSSSSSSSQGNIHNSYPVELPQLEKPPRKTRAPAELPITDSMRAWATENGITSPLEFETEKMLDHFRGKGETRLDWIATWRTWMRNSKKFNGSNGNGKGKTYESYETQRVRKLKEQMAEFSKRISEPDGDSVRPGLGPVTGKSVL